MGENNDRFARTRLAPPNDPDEQTGRTIAARVHTIGCSGLRTISIRGFRLSSGDGGDVAGFDLGPSPEEHLLGALGAGLAQTIAHAACAHDLSVDRLDIDLAASLTPEDAPCHIAGRIVRIATAVVIESEDPAAAFDGIDEEILASSPLVALINVPVTLSLRVDPVDPAHADADDWQI